MLGEAHNLARAMQAFKLCNKTSYCSRENGSTFNNNFATKLSPYISRNGYTGGEYFNARS